MGTETEVSDSLTVRSGTSDDQGVLTLGGSQSQLVQGDSLTTSLENGSLGTSSESQSGNSALGELQDSVVISDGTDDDNSLLGSTLLLEDACDSGNRDGGLVDLGKEQRSQDDLVEGSISTA